MTPPNILYSCSVLRSSSSEQFIPDHILIYQISGSLIINDGIKEYNMQPGDLCFAKRNRLARYIKQPPENGEYKTISVRFEQNFLRSFSSEYGYTSENLGNQDSVMKLNCNELVENYFYSLVPYLTIKKTNNEDLFFLKTKEILLILLKTTPSIKEFLFDFDEPGKVNLESFMNSNFQFNVSLKRLSYLTGRSLTTFKRDFKNIFNCTPGTWLLRKRLEEAYYLIDKQKSKPSEVYLEVGFKDLSHFSFAFKKAFGLSPSQLVRKKTLFHS